MAEYSCRGKSENCHRLQRFLVIWLSLLSPWPLSFFHSNDVSKTWRSRWAQNIHSPVLCSRGACLTSAFAGRQKRGMHSRALLGLSSQNPPRTPVLLHRPEFLPALSSTVWEHSRCCVFPVSDGSFTIALLVPLLGARVSVPSWSARRRQCWNPTEHVHGCLYGTRGITLQVWQIFCF